MLFVHILILFNFFSQYRHMQIGLREAPIWLTPHEALITLATPLSWGGLWWWLDDYDEHVDEDGMEMGRSS